LKFTAYKHQVLKNRPSITKQLFWSGILIFGFAFILIFLNIEMPLFENIQDLVFPFLLVSLFLIICAYVYQFYDFERIESKKDGHIAFNEDGLIIDYSKNFKYAELAEIQFGIDAYYGEKINLTYRNPIERKSIGIKNYILLVTNSDTYKFNIKLENEVHFKELENTIFKLVQTEKLSNIDPKKLIKLVPNRFKQTNEYKNFVLRQIVEKKIGCTEGLLLHGYKTDKEAAELRKKYCG
tara:strand:+ start:375 stop:1088 length:714 start_codon:yes stop_codon:yes gene_type:complete